MPELRGLFQSDSKRGYGVVTVLIELLGQAKCNSLFHRPLLYKVTFFSCGLGELMKVVEAINMIRYQRSSTNLPSPRLFSNDEIIHYYRNYNSTM